MCIIQTPVIPWICFEIRRKKSFDVISKILKTEINNRCPDGGYFETISMSNDPTAHKSTITPTHHSHFIFIGNTHFNYFVNTSHQVNKIFSAPVGTIGHSEISSIAGRTSWIGTKNGITHFGKSCNWISTRITRYTSLLKYTGRAAVCI